MELFCDWKGVIDSSENKTAIFLLNYSDTFGGFIAMGIYSN